MMMLLLAACLPFTADRDRVTVADLAAAEPALNALPPDTALGYAPSPGVHRIFSVADLTRLGQRFGVTLEPRHEICIERPAVPLEPSSMLAAMRESLAIPGARIEIIEQSRYPVPDGHLEFPRAGLISPPPSRPDSAALWKGWMHYGGNRRCAIWVRVRIVVRAQRLVAAVTVGAGRAIEASQLRIESYEGFPLRVKGLETIEQAAGQAPKRTLAAGTVLTAADLDAPLDVKRGDTVRVAVSSGEAHLELDGRAEASGRRGQTITILNPASGKRFSGRIESAGHVEVTNP